MGYMTFYIIIMNNGICIGITKSKIFFLQRIRFYNNIVSSRFSNNQGTRKWKKKKKIGSFQNVILSRGNERGNK